MRSQALAPSPNRRRPQTLPDEMNSLPLRHTSPPFPFPYRAYVSRRTQYFENPRSRHRGPARDRQGLSFPGIPLAARLLSRLFRTFFSTWAFSFHPWTLVGGSRGGRRGSRTLGCGSLYVLDWILVMSSGRTVSHQVNKEAPTSACLRRGCQALIRSLHQRVSLAVANLPTMGDWLLDGATPPRIRHIVWPSTTRGPWGPGCFPFFQNGRLVCRSPTSGDSSADCGNGTSSHV